MPPIALPPKVIYTISGFISKNKDEFSIDLTELLTVHTEITELQKLAIKDVEKKADSQERDCH